MARRARSRLAAWVAALLGGAAAGGDAVPALQEPHAPGWEGFPALVWRASYPGREPPAEILEGFGGTNVEGAEEAAWVRSAGLDFYVGHGPGRNVLYLEREGAPYQETFARWDRERDPDLLVREPCLTADATRRELERLLAASLSAREGEHGLGVSLGDEISLTPFGDPLDLCRSPTCESGFREWLAQHAPSVRWEGYPTAPTTDELRLARAEGEHGFTPPWLLRRRYHRAVLADTLARLAERVRSEGAAAGLLGISGPTAFGGVALSEVLPSLDFIECYRTGDAREVLFSGRSSKQRTLLTLFPEIDGLEECVRQLWEHWLRGGDGVVIWSDGFLERHPAVRQALAEAVERLRAWDRALAEFRPAPAGLALVHDPDALSLAFLEDALLDGATWPNRFAAYQERHGSLERARNAWLRLAEDVGLQPGALPWEAIGAETARRYPLLVLVHQRPLGAPQAARLEAFLAAGGSLVCQGPTALYDELGRPSAEGRLADWEERFPGRVHPGFEGIEDVLLTRQTPGHPRARARRDELRALLVEAGAGTLPVQRFRRAAEGGAGEKGLPGAGWFAAWDPEAELLVLLAPTGADELGVQPAEGWSLAPLTSPLPRPGRGDPRFYRLRRREGD